jgi:HEAT repeat protein
MRRVHAWHSRGDHHSIADTPALIAELGSQDGVVRERARAALVALGKPSVAPLVKALSDQDEQVRWEAANALGCLCDRSAAAALVAALGDERPGVRWLAAEALIALRFDALDPMLKALLAPGNAASLGAASRRVLHVLAKKRGGQWLTPLVAAFDSYEPEIAVPLAAFRALEQLRMMAAAGIAGRPIAGSAVGREIARSEAAEGGQHAES